MLRPTDMSYISASTNINMTEPGSPHLSGPDTGSFGVVQANQNNSYVRRWKQPNVTNRQVRSWCPTPCVHSTWSKSWRDSSHVRAQIRLYKYDFRGCLLICDRSVAWFLLVRLYYFLHLLNRAMMPLQIAQMCRRQGFYQKMPEKKLRRSSLVASNAAGLSSN